MKPIVQQEAPVLRQMAKPVPEALFGTDDLARIIADMAETLDAEPDGVAIAATQIGTAYRIFIVRTDRTLPPPPDGAPAHAPHNDVYINPEIVKTSRRRQQADEGCLSVRGIYGTTDRHERVTVKAKREDGSTFTRGGGGLLAQIFEHEIDHLNGVLFIDHATDLVHARPSHVTDLPDHVA